jgi:hypothetical protein
MKTAFASWDSSAGRESSEKGLASGSFSPQVTLLCSSMVHVHEVRGFMQTLLDALLGSSPAGKDSSLTNDENHENSQAKHIINEHKKQERDDTITLNNLSVCS